jgi:hypothetical protein
MKANIEIIVRKRLKCNEKNVIEVMIEFYHNFFDIFRLEIN